MMTVYLAELTIRSNSTILFHALRCPSIVLLNSSPQICGDYLSLTTGRNFLRRTFSELSLFGFLSVTLNISNLPPHTHRPASCAVPLFPTGFWRPCGFLLPSYLLPFIACICCICTSRRAQSYSEGVADSTSFPGYTAICPKRVCYVKFTRT